MTVKMVHCYQPSDGLGRRGFCTTQVIGWEIISKMTYTILSWTLNLTVSK